MLKTVWRIHSQWPWREFEGEVESATSRLVRFGVVITGTYLYPPALLRPLQADVIYIEPIFGDGVRPVVVVTRVRVGIERVRVPRGKPHPFFSISRERIET